MTTLQGFQSFNKLPAETRIQIYDLVLDLDRTIILFEARLTRWVSSLYNCGIDREKNLVKALKPTNNTAILLGCRQWNNEISSRLYGNSTFTVGDSEILDVVLESIGGGTRSRLRYLHVQFNGDR
jgi:hypothetical protein